MNNIFFFSPTNGKKNRYLFSNQLLGTIPSQLEKLTNLQKLFE